MRRPRLPPPILLTLLVALLVVASPAPRPAAQTPAAPPPARPERSVELLVPTIAAEGGGTLIALAPVAERLGGRLERHPGGSWSLTFPAGDRALFGPDSGAVAIGTEILPLSLAPRLADGALFVPPDFLSEVYGRFGNWRLSFDATTGRLAAVERRGRTLPVNADVVHLQGVTTVVLQFPERPAYRVDERPGRIVVELPADRVEAARQRPIQDPLVRGIAIEGQRITLDLVPGAEAESYTLDGPFRLVFDVHRAAVATVPQAPELGPPTPPEGIRLIVLDPGHGGTESGAIGTSGVAEKDLTLAIARQLKGRLEAALPVRVVLTRDEDAHLPLETRTAIANQNKADLFISLHLNSAFGAAAHGAETYFLSATASDERAARSAAAENRPGGPPAAGGEPLGEDPLYDLQLILWDLAQNHFLSQSQQLAKLIQGELNSTLDLRDRGVKQAPFVVLMGAAMPAVLVELGFLSNPEEDRRLQDPAYRDELAAALVRAISRYREGVEAQAAEARTATGAGQDPEGGE
jgi:N-acetylmuramoyl-L-alanine amidase